MFIMRKIIISTLILALVLTFAASCKKPKSQSEKISVQQKIETPTMKMAEAPQNVPQNILQPAQTPTPAPTTTTQAPTPAPVATTPAPTPASPASQTIVKNSTNLEVILDASGSMNSPIDTTTKIDIIKSALKEALSTPVMPEMKGRKVALRVFGNKSTSDKNDCTDVTLSVPMGPFDQNTFNAALAGVKPKGTAPLAFALEEANKDFTESSDAADNVILLITDGGDTCSGDPLVAAERLHKSASKVIVNVIGFDIDQNAQAVLKKIAEITNGSFTLARSVAEVATGIDQVMNANLPYNLRVKVLSGGSPIQSIITIFKANTQSVIDRADASGIKFFKLLPGSYDISVEYRGSIETVKPTKIIKGVEVTNTSKAEQVVQFDLGNINLTMTDETGKETMANLYIRKSGANDLIGQLMDVQSPQMISLTPGVYDIDAETAQKETTTLTAQIRGIEVKVGETTEQTIKFQTGKLSLKAQNSAKQAISIAYKITKPDSQEVVAEGDGTVEGAIVDLPPGTYDAYVRWAAPDITGSAETKLSNVEIKGGETIEQLVTIVSGTLKLSGKDTKNKYVHTEFSIKKSGQTEEVLKATSEDSPVEVFMAPGTYDITAVNTTSKVVPPPSVAWNGVVVKEGQSQSMDAVFKLGTIKLIGKNAKEQIIATTFTVYRGGTDEPIVTENSEREWVVFNLTPGFYDIKAEDSNAKSDPKPTIWFHDMEIREGQSITNEAIFTSGKLKLICRGKNNIILTCEFNVFTYGSDTALFSGATVDEWREFDIPPGKYYLEVGWHDPVEEQFLKKWINISIDQNQVLEEVLRF